MDRTSTNRIDENSLTKGQLRKLNALRKSVGDNIGERAFAEWLALQRATGEKPDRNATVIVEALWPFVEEGQAHCSAEWLHRETRAWAHHRGAGVSVDLPGAAAGALTGRSGIIGRCSGRFARSASIPSK